MIRKKICMLGAYAVGKTSLVERFVKDIFRDTYRTTVGVKITRKEVRVGETDLSLLVWDLHGDDEFQTVRSSYLRGASGALLVTDGTRASTLEQALALRQRLHAVVGDVPTLLLLNKADLEAEWELDQEHLARLGIESDRCLASSAKTGAGVERAFQELARRMLEV